MRKKGFSRQREQLIDNELRSQGIRDEVVLEAMRSVPREKFVCAAMRKFAYHNAPLPIGCGQTISQPLIVATMIEALELAPHERVLEIGTGSGYAAAVLSRIAKEVFTVERVRKLADTARARLERLGYDNVYVRHADGTLGWPEQSPFEAAIVAAGGPGVPSSLLHQLCIGGRLVIPIGAGKDFQQLIRVVRRREDYFDYQEICAVHFVPLVGDAGWQEEMELAQPQVATTSLPKTPGPLETIQPAAEPIWSLENPDLAPCWSRSATRDWN